MGITREPQVIIVGAGPVGLSLAVGLGRRGVDSLVIEKQQTTSEHSRAPGILPRTLEILGQWGVVNEVLGVGTMLERPCAYDGARDSQLLCVPAAELGVECRYPALCILGQNTFERILLEAARETGCAEIAFGHELVGLRQDGDGVTVSVRAEDEVRTLQARYVVGCDGASSTVRDQLGLSFDGETYPLDAILADVTVPDADDVPFPRVDFKGQVVCFSVRLETGAWRVVAAAPGSTGGSDVSDAEVAGLVRRLLGTREHDTEWASRFKLHRRLAPRFRVGRVLLAGDAGHINSPVGGQGMNSGIQDAHNLAWKLAAALDGADEERLLESYHIERHDLVDRVVNRRTDLLTRAVMSPSALRPLVGRVVLGVFSLAPTRYAMMRNLSMLAGEYRSSPLMPAPVRGVGQRLPDVVLGEGDSLRLHDLVGENGALVWLDGPGDNRSLPPGVTHVRVHEGQADHSGMLRRRFGRHKVLVVRPDMIVGWTGAADDKRQIERMVQYCLGR